jgi:hypothetical protein
LKVFPAARLLTCGSFAALLCACGGGGGSTSLPAAPAPTLAPPASPTPSPSPYPVTEGDKFTYTGSITQTFTRFATPAPSPDPGATPEPTSTPWTGSTSDAVTQNVVLHSGASFNGTAGLIEMDTHETDQGDHMVTTTIDSQQYLSLAADSSRSDGVNLTQVGVKTTDSSGVATTTTVGAGNGVLDRMPQIPQAQWTNSAARTFAESDSSGITINDSYNADGSYTGSVNFPQGGSSSIAENSDGSGTYKFPLLGVSTQSSLTFSSVNPSDNTITIAFTDHADSPVTLFNFMPAWYPSIPPVLAGDTFVDFSQTTLPSTCNVGSGLPKQATRIDETRTQLDTIFGEVETYKASSYVAGPYGVICTVIHDTLVYYYDLTGQSAFLNGFRPYPIQETDTDETLAMQSATASSTARRASSVAAAAPIAAPAFLHSQLALAKRHILAVKHLSDLHRKAQ